jgi:predicted nucleic acid-binding protein
LSVKRHASQLMRSTPDAIYHNAITRIYRRYRQGEISKEEAKEQLEMLKHELAMEG